MSRKGVGMFAALAGPAGIAMILVCAPQNAAGAVRTASRSGDADSVRMVVNLPVRTGRWNPSSIANLGYDSIYRGTVDKRLEDAWRQIKESGALLYVRVHNVFSDSDSGCRVYSEDKSGRPQYDWSRLDAVLDTFVKAGVRPVLVCDYMPDSLAAGEIVRNTGGGGINLPKDFTKWKELVRRLVLHCERRYGQEEVRKWYFEVWNEPDGVQHWIGAKPPLTYEKIVRFFELYDYFAAGAKEADPQVRIGGPALGGSNIDYRFARYFLLHCVRGENFATGKKEGAPIDFISWHAYGDLNSILGANERYRTLIEQEAPSLAGCERHLNEWGQKLGDSSHWPHTRNHYEAAFACALLERVLDDESARVDLLLRSGGLTGEYFSGWRCLFTQIGGRTIPVALFNLYRLLGKMSSDRVKVIVNPADGSVGAIGTSDSPVSLQLLLWRFEEGNFEETGAERKFTITVRGLEERFRVVKSWQYQIDAEHCDAWSEWRRMGSPTPATTKDAEAILRKGVLSRIGEEKSIPVRRGTAIITLTLPSNSVCLLVVGKEGNPRDVGNTQREPSMLTLPSPLLP